MSAYGWCLVARSGVKCRRCCLPSIPAAKLRGWCLIATISPDALSAEELRETWPALSDEERLDAFRLLPYEERRVFFSQLATADQAQTIEGLPDAEAAIWLGLLPPDDVADLLQSVSAETRQRLETLLEPAARLEAGALLAYAEDEAGGLMNPRFARLRPDMSVDAAISYLRRQTQNRLATFYYAYVLEGDQRLVGVVSFRELFAADGGMRVDQLMHRDLIVARDSTNQEEVARLIAAHNLTALPVLDGEDRMRGVVTVDDIVDVVQEEATEDIHRMGAVESLGAPYLQVGFGQMIRKRGGWLAVLFLGEMLTATAMGYFEHEIERAVVLAMFVPLIISSGGNSGSQAATLAVRALALRELRLRDWVRVLWREVRNGVVLGAGLGAIGFVRVLTWQNFGLYNYGPHYLLVAATVWVSLIGVVAFGTVAGSMLPFVLRRIGFDPATSSAPFVATLVDVSGLVIYFGVAAFILRGALL